MYIDKDGLIFYSMLLLKRWLDFDEGQQQLALQTFVAFIAKVVEFVRGIIYNGRLQNKGASEGSGSLLKQRTILRRGHDRDERQTRGRGII